MALDPQLWFISITTLKDAADFSNWLSGRRVECQDTMEFNEWLRAYNAFPLSFYLDGVVYSLATRQEANIWLNAWSAAMNLRIANHHL